MRSSKHRIVLNHGGYDWAKAVAFCRCVNNHSDVYACVFPLSDGTAEIGIAFGSSFFEDVFLFKAGTECEIFAVLCSESQPEVLDSLIAYPEPHILDGRIGVVNLTIS